MNRHVVFVVMGVAISGGFLAGGCADGPQKPVTGEDPVVTGKLKMNLETTSDSGKIYRLRNALFPIDGGSGITLNSENDPTKSVLEAFLSPTFHTIELREGWFVEQVDELLGSAFFVDATLISSSFQFFEIRSQEETFVKFDFEVDGRRISFGPPGRLIVGIGVHERICGNGIMESGEACDGFDFGFQTCSSVTLGSLPNGFLQCTSQCFLDTSFCTGGDGGVGGFGAGGFPPFDGSVGAGGAFPATGGVPATGGAAETGGASAGGIGGGGTGGRGRGQG